jgi:hypothetical protein
MFTLDNFAAIFCVDKRTIERKIRKIAPILKNFDTKKKKYYYTENEANFVIKTIGIPPDTNFNRQLADRYPNLFK